jgi:hypothetical protein
MFLLHVRNDKGLKYARVAGMTDPAQIIRAIRIGTGTVEHPEGYCTDPAYEGKILNLIKQYNLDRFDPDVKSSTVQEKPVNPSSAAPPQNKTLTRVQVGVYSHAETRDFLIKRIKEETGFDCFYETSGKNCTVYCGSFEQLDKAKEREKILREHNFNCLLKTVMA